MKFYRVETKHILAPTQERIGDVKIANQPLRQWQQEAIEANGGQVVDLKDGEPWPEDAAYVFTDDLFFTAQTVALFLPAPAGSRLAIGPSVFLSGSAALQDNPVLEGGSQTYSFFKVSGSVTSSIEEAQRQLSPYTLPLKEDILEIPVQEHYFGTNTLKFSMTQSPIIRIRHWMHVLWASRAAIGLYWASYPKWRLIVRGLWAILRTLSFNRHRILAHFNDIGANTDIHPSAVIEGSVIGKGCSIGPHCRVRFSRLGDGVVMQGGAQAEFSVLGDNALVSQNCAVNFSVLGEGAAASHYLVQLSYLGDRAVTVGGSFLLDTHFTSTVKVKLEGELRDSGERFLGVGLGKDVRLGAGVWIPAGRDVPNGYTIVRAPDSVASRIPEGLPEGVPLHVHEGRVKVIGEDS